MNMHNFLDGVLSARIAVDEYSVPWMRINSPAGPKSLDLTDRDSPEYLYELYLESTPGPESPKKQFLEEVNRRRLKAKFELPATQQSLRMAGTIERIEIDLGGEEEEVLIITSEGHAMGRPRQAFVRPLSMLPLPVPLEMDQDRLRGTWLRLQSFLRLSDHQMKLLTGVMLSAFLPLKEIPVCYIRGPEGAGKGVLTQAIKLFTDPNTSPYQPLYGGTLAIVEAMRQNRVVCIDNISSDTFSGRYSDLFAQLSTGTTINQPRKHGFRGSCGVSGSRLVVLNGIDDFVTRSDLLSRAIPIRLKGLSSGVLEEVNSVLPRLEQMQHQVFSSIVYLLRKVAARYSGTYVQTNSRMIGLVRAMAACEEELGWSRGAFQRALAEECDAARLDRVEEIPAIVAVRAMMEGRSSWTGTISELLTELRRYAGSSGGSNCLDLPRSPVSLGRVLGREKVALESVGIICDERRQASKRLRTLLRKDRLLSFSGDRMTG